MRVILLVCLSVLVCVASARSITWTGAAGNALWNFANNWDANAVPTSADDVTINVVGGVIVSISAPAAANSLTIGGGTYNQALNLFNSLSVGSGGIQVREKGTLSVSTNNDLPLSSAGPVRFQGGATFTWNSGDVTGPGIYTIDAGAALSFSGSALKLLDRVTFNVRGQTTIQPTTIQFTRGAVLNLFANTTVIGQVNIFTNDNSANLLNVNGNFTYQGSAISQPLNIQVNSTFQSGLNIISGGVTVSSSASFTGVVSVPITTTLTVQSGLQNVFFRSVQGQGSFFVNSVATVGTAQISVLNLAASGSLTTQGAISTKALVVAGKLIIQSNVFTTVDVTISAGTVTGAGRLTATGNTEIAVASNGNANNFISADIQVAGRGYTTGSVVILFADLGNLHVLSTGTFTISATANFQKQTGNPVVTNDGTFTVNLPVGNVWTVSVDFRGANGALSLTGGSVIFQGDTSIANKVVTSNVLIQFLTAVAQWGPVSGTGSINVTASPSATSSFGQTSVSYFGAVQGNVNVASLTANTLELFNAATLTVGAGQQSATIFNFYGGTLSGRATLISSSVAVYAYSPVTIDSIAITAKQFKFSPATAATQLQVLNHATISIGY